MTVPPADALVQSMVNRTEVSIDEEALAEIASAPVSIEDYAPLEQRPAGFSETLMRRIVYAIVLGSPMPRLTTPAERALRDTLVAETKEIYAAGGYIELPYETPGDDDGEDQ